MEQWNTGMVDGGAVTYATCDCIAENGSSKGRPWDTGNLNSTLDWTTSVSETLFRT